MAHRVGVWGIEVGQSALKALRLENVGGQITATAFDYIEHPKILNQPDADPDFLTRESLSKFLERNKLKGDTVVLGVPGQSGLARFVKLPPVEEKKVLEIVRFEAKQQIPFPLEEVLWDFQKLSSGLVSEGFAMETEVGLFAMKRDIVLRFLQHFTDLDVEVHVIQMAPLALCNYISYDLLRKGEDPAAEAEKEASASNAGFKKRCVVVLDIGTDSSNLVVTDGDRLIWQRPIPFGGNRFTNALTKEFKLTFAKAEHLKRNAAKSPDIKRILATFKPVLNEFVGEVQRSLGFFTNTNRDAHVEYLMGLGNAFRLPGLQKFLSEKLQLEVRKLQKLERLAGDAVLSVPAFADNLASFATAYGLALQGLGVAHLRTNLLPQELRTARMVRAKKPWAVAAAASLLLALSATAVGYTLQYRAVAAPDVVEARKQGEAFVKKVKNFESTFATEEGQIKNDESAVKDIISGQEERLNWLVLNRYVNECLPVPALRLEGTLKKIEQDKCVVEDYDGKKHTIPLLNNPSYVPIVDGKIVGALDLKEGRKVAFAYQVDPKTRSYWGEEAKKAYLQFWASQAGGKGADVKAGEESAKDLIQIHLEAVNTAYSSDLKAYFEQLQKKKENKKYQEDMPNAKDKEALPEGKGWVVELRGFTHHKGRGQFVMDTLVENLDKRAAQQKEAAEPPKEAAAPPAKDAPPKEEAADKPKDDPRAKVIPNRISHVILYGYKNVENPDPVKFDLIGGSVLPDLVSSRGNWKSACDNRTKDDDRLGGNQQGGGNGGGAAKAKSSTTRSEFIVLFIWKEPVTDNEPADDGQGQGNTAGNAGPGGGQPGGGGQPAGPPPAPK